MTIELKEKIRRILSDVTFPTISPRAWLEADNPEPASILISPTEFKQLVGLGLLELPAELTLWDVAE